MTIGNVMNCAVKKVFNILLGLTLCASTAFAQAPGIDSLTGADAKTPDEVKKTLGGGGYGNSVGDLSADNTAQVPSLPSNGAIPGVGGAGSFMGEESAPIDRAYIPQDSVSGFYGTLTDKGSSENALSALGNPNSVFFTTLHLTEPGVAAGQRDAMMLSQLALTNRYLAQQNLYTQFQLSGNPGDYNSYVRCIQQELSGLSAAAGAVTGGDTWIKAQSKCAGDYVSKTNLIGTASITGNQNISTDGKTFNASHLSKGLTGEAGIVAGGAAPITGALKPCPAVTDDYACLSDIIFGKANVASTAAGYVGASDIEIKRKAFVNWIGDLQIIMKAGGGVGGAVGLPGGLGTTGQIVQRQEGEVAPKAGKGWQLLRAMRKESFNSMMTLLRGRCEFALKNGNVVTSMSGSSMDYTPFGDSQGLIAANPQNAKPSTFWQALGSTGGGAAGTVPGTGGDYQKAREAVEDLSVQGFAFKPVTIDSIYRVFMAKGDSGGSGSGCGGALSTAGGVVTAVTGDTCGRFAESYCTFEAIETALAPKTGNALTTVSSTVMGGSGTVPDEYRKVYNMAATYADYKYSIWVGGMRSYTVGRLQQLKREQDEINTAVSFIDRKTMWNPSIPGSIASEAWGTRRLSDLKAMAESMNTVAGASSGTSGQQLRGVFQGRQKQMVPNPWTSYQGTNGVGIPNVPNF